VFDIRCASARFFQPQRVELSGAVPHASHRHTRNALTRIGTKIPRSGLIAIALSWRPPHKEARSDGGVVQNQIRSAESPFVPSSILDSE
jgi:hypothetical protein